MPEIRVALEAPDMAPERLDHATHLMQHSLKGVDGLAVHRVREPPPPDSLSGAGALVAELLLVGSLGASSVPTVRSVLTRWVEYRGHRAVTLRCGELRLRIDADTGGQAIESALDRMTAETSE